MSEIDDADGSRIWRFSGCELHSGLLELRVNGEAADIDRKPLLILKCLLEASGEVVTKEELFDAVWGGQDVAESSITRGINKLRQTIGDVTKSIIETRHGIGYRIAGEISLTLAERITPLLSVKAGDAVSGRPHWILERPLGQGGFGEVWSARHAKTAEERVFKFGLTDRHLIGLKREVTVSRLIQDTVGDSRGFVRIIDWNFDQPPFFVEMAPGGIALTEWVASESGARAWSDLNRRLELFCQLCDAVVLAHAVGVIHKDIKPGNILIAETHEGAVCRLIDFGSGRLTRPGDLDRLGITRNGFTQPLPDSISSGTPIYTAPEIFSGSLPTTQADVYSLGILLFQFVTADLSRQLSPGWESDVEDELLRTDIGAATHGRPEHRLQAVAQLAERVRTLDIRRAERATARAREELASRNAKALEATRARRPYLVAVAAVLIASLAAGAVLLKQLSNSRAQALQELATSKAVLRFVQDDLIGSANPSAGGRTNMTIGEAVGRATHSLPARFQDKPITEAALRGSIGHIFEVLQQRDDAVTQTRAAAELLNRALGPEDPKTLIAREEYADALANDHQFDEASSILTAVEPALIARFGADSPEVAQVRFDQLRIPFLQGRHSDCVEPIKALLVDLEKNPNADTGFVFRVRQAYLTSLISLLRYKEAEVASAQLILDATQAFGPDHANTYWSHFLHGTALRGEQKWDDAIAEMRLAEKGYLELAGPKDSGTLTIQHHLGFLYGELDRNQEANDVLQHVYDGMRAANGDDDAKTLGALRDLATARAVLGHPEEAIQLYARAQETYLRLYGPDDRNRLINAWYLVDSELDAGRVADAQQLLSEIEPRGNRIFPSGSPWPGLLLYVKGRLSWAQGDHKRAVDDWQSAVPLLTQATGPESPDTQHAKKLLDLAGKPNPAKIL